MTRAAFAVALVLFHGALFLSFWLHARGRPRAGRGAMAVAGAFLAFVLYDLARDPAPERLGGLAMGLTFMFALLWLGAAVLFMHVANGVGVPTPGVAWLLARAPSWTASGSVGTLLGGVVFPRLRCVAGPALPAAARLPLLVVGAALAAAGVHAAAVRTRAPLRRVRDPATPPGERRAEAARAARATWLGLAAGLAGLVLLDLATLP